MGYRDKNAKEGRLESQRGQDLYISIDMNIQSYAQQLAYTTLAKKNAKRVSIIVMNPNNGELYAMVNVPEYNLNEPYVLNYEVEDDGSSGNKWIFLIICGEISALMILMSQVQCLKW